MRCTIWSYCAVGKRYPWKGIALALLSLCILSCEFIKNIIDQVVSSYAITPKLLEYLTSTNDTHYRAKADHSYVNNAYNAYHT